MNNDKNSHHLTPSGTTAHPEQTVPDNNPVNRLKFRFFDDNPDDKYTLMVTVPYSLFVFIVILALMEGGTLFWIFSHLGHHVPPGAR